MKQRPFKNISFNLYRYQLLPITQNIQPDLFREILTLEQLKESKNDLFREVLSNLTEFIYKSSSLEKKQIIDKDDWFIFKLGVRRKVEREVNFNKEELDTWPHVTIIINNNPNCQLIAISTNRKAFAKTEIVTKILVDSLSKPLEKLQLTMNVQALYHNQVFWDLVEAHKGKIQSVKFELISPNMANISKTLKVDLRQINVDTNSHKTCLELNAPANAALEIKEDNEIIDGLVEYASKGCGDIVLKVKGLKKRIHTNKSSKTIEIDELTVENFGNEALEMLLNEFKDEC